MNFYIQLFCVHVSHISSIDIIYLDQLCCHKQDSTGSIDPRGVSWRVAGPRDDSHSPPAGRGG